MNLYSYICPYNHHQDYVKGSTVSSSNSTPLKWNPYSDLYYSRFSCICFELHIHIIIWYILIHLLPYVTNSILESIWILHRRNKEIVSSLSSLSILMCQYVLRELYQISYLLLGVNNLKFRENDFKVDLQKQV